MRKHRENLEFIAYLLLWLIRFLFLFYMFAPFLSAYLPWNRHSYITDVELCLFAHLQYMYVPYNVRRILSDRLIDINAFKKFMI